MSPLFAGVLTSIALGALTIFHPCPLATNIAAVSFLCTWKERHRDKLLTGSLFVLGEITTLAALGSFISLSVVNIPSAANFFQDYILQLFGPIFILSGMMLLGILLPRQRILKIPEKLLKLGSKIGRLGGLFLGVLVALTFCPMSAAIFFGVLVPLSVSNDAVVLYPLFYGVGASLPLMIIAILVSRSTAILDRYFLMKKPAEKILRKMAGTVMILLGVFLSLRHIFRVI